MDTLVLGGGHTTAELMVVVRSGFLDDWVQEQ